VRIAVIKNIATPYTTPVFERLSRRGGCELLVVYESIREPNRPWTLSDQRPSYPHRVLQSRTVDLSRLASDAYVHLPRQPLKPLSRFEPDVVVASGAGIWSSPANVAALIARRRGRWAFVPYWESFTHPKQSLPRRLADPWVRAFVGSGDAWIACGSRAARELKSLGADPSRTVISPLIASPSNATASGGPTSRGQGPPRFLFVGQLIKRKAVDVLLRAFRELAGGELWIVGDGPLSTEVQLAASGDPRITLFGYLDAVALARLYRRTDAVVLPSRYDTWGLVVNEAMAHGKPVVVTDQVGAGDDLVEDGTTGLVVPADDASALAQALREVASWDRERREAVATRTREKLEQWSIERTVEGLVRACALAQVHRRG
jgi:glycosyltransferase involved in cell wall biosynthesis